MSKKILLSILAIVLGACLILSAVMIVGAVVIFRPVSTQTVVSTETVVAATPTSSSIENQMDQIQQEVSSYRGLQLKQPLKRSLITTTQLKDQVIHEFFADYTAEDEKRDVDVLSAFGLLPAGFNLHDFYVKLYSEQVAGYYDDKTKEMYVVSDEGFNGPERMTYAHEFTHALQDQNYDLENGLKLNEHYCKTHTEYCAAATALIEGDATLSEQYWLFSFSTDKDKQQITEFQQTYTSPVYDSAPAYMKQDFLFPYTQGLNFVNTLYSKNKWAGVDAAYKNPPVSTEQILHPEKYPGDVPIDVTVPDLTTTLGSGWKEIDRNVMGEWYTYLVLADGRDPSFRLEDQTAKDAAAGWGGDTYVYYTNTAANQFAVVWQSVWDTANDSDQFWQASLTYGKDRWGNPVSESASKISWQTSDAGQVMMEQSGKTVLWLMTPSTGIQQNVLSKLTLNGK